ncbi:SGNH/GDSL hydrolase family protein [Edaphobacter aggregans]|uniref:SGNH/GDSL hydrolase family protein n=1 Tax=Edaphobacter aggregans TaxID=570835 RepID=UPI00069043A0|nr:SGNH/GDSL hydrolase family protein [Edaphobacter aggregans]
MLLRFIALLSLIFAIPSPAQSSPFQLHDGDTLVFYGDSITEQRLYTVYVATAVRTQHPTWHIRFYNAGVGGDRVTGGGAGPIDTRLTRDVISRHPTVVAIMLGMNDRATPETRAAYTPGYEHILTRLRNELPGVRLSVIAPSPFDQITRPDARGNDPLVSFTAIDKSLATKFNANFVDLNTPLTAALIRANAANPLATKLAVPDRVHPTGGFHWLMAETILRGWNMPQVAASVTLDGRTGKPLDQQASTVHDSQTSRDKLQWTETDNPDTTIFDSIDGNEALFRILTDAPHLGQRILRVENLASGTYTLDIDGKPLPAHFSSADLATGVDLSMMPTPMHVQGRAVFYACSDSDALQISRIRAISRTSELPTDTPLAEGTKFLDQVIDAAERRIAAAAAPKNHTFVLQRMP